MEGTPTTSVNVVGKVMWQVVSALSTPEAHINEARISHNWNDKLGVSPCQEDTSILFKTRWLVLYYHRSIADALNPARTLFLCRANIISLYCVSHVSDSFGSNIFFSNSCSRLRLLHSLNIFMCTVVRVVYHLSCPLWDWEQGIFKTNCCSLKKHRITECLRVTISNLSICPHKWRQYDKLLLWNIWKVFVYLRIC